MPTYTVCVSTDCCAYFSHFCPPGDMPTYRKSYAASFTDLLYLCARATRTKLRRIFFALLPHFAISTLFRRITNSTQVPSLPYPYSRGTRTPMHPVLPKAGTEGIINFARSTNSKCRSSVNVPQHFNRCCVEGISRGNPLSPSVIVGKTNQFL